MANLPSIEWVRGNDRGLKVLDHQLIGYDERTQPIMTGVKGRYATETVK